MISTENTFLEYPDIVTPQQLKKMINVSIVTAYKLLREGYIYYFKIGDRYRIPKESVIEYINYNQDII